MDVCIVYFILVIKQLEDFKNQYYSFYTHSYLKWNIVRIVYNTVGVDIVLYPFLLAYIKLENIAWFSELLLLKSRGGEKGLFIVRCIIV